MRGQTPDTGATYVGSIREEEAVIMKRLLIATVALSALAGAAFAQPAYHPAAGGPPSDYPMCTHRGQDRCQQRGPGGWHGGGHDWGHHHHHHDHDGDHGHSSTDGERG